MDALLRGKSERWRNCRIKPGSFSPIDVLGHLIYGEITDWIPRARIILECQESRAFDPFDRFGFAPLLEGASPEELLATWVVHDLGHIAQVVRAMSNEYNEAVGPWREYLSILK